MRRQVSLIFYCLSLDLARKAKLAETNQGRRWLQYLVKPMLINLKLPVGLENLLAEPSTQVGQDGVSLDQRLTLIMQVLCQVWQCERCFLCLRDPDSSLTRITHSHCTRPDHSSLLESDWVLEDAAVLTDPLMVLAFQSPDAVYVEDVETADAATINLAYEQQVFKSRALIHIPLYSQRRLYGILEPCVFDQPRVWTKADRWVAMQMQQRLEPLVIEYLRQVQRLAKS